MAEFVVTSPDGKEKYKVTVSDEELQRSFEQRQPAPSTDYGPLRDVGRGLARGAIEGPTSDVAGTFGDIESIARRGGESLGFEPSGNAAPTSAELSERLGIGLRPTTPYGEVAETVARSVTNPANYIFGPVEATLGRTFTSERTCGVTSIQRWRSSKLQGSLSRTGPFHFGRWVISTRYCLKTSTWPSRSLSWRCSWTRMTL